MSQTPQDDRTEDPTVGGHRTPQRSTGDDDKPMLLLDIDGVLNAFPEHSDLRNYSRHLIDGYRIHLHRDAPQMVSALEQEFEIVWFTLWNHRATPAIGPHVGLTATPHLTTSWERGWEAAAVAGYGDAEISRLMYAKTPLLPHLVPPGRRWVWIDDAHSRWDHEYLVTAGMDPSQFRLVRTDPDSGLTWSDVERALGFVRGGVDPGDAGLTEDPRLVARYPGSVVGRVDAAGEGPMPPGDGVVDLVAEFSELVARLESPDTGVCPDCCGITKPVAYGLPSDALIEAAERGDVLLGGCCPPPFGPEAQCESCGREVGTRADGF